MAFDLFTRSHYIYIHIIYKETAMTLRLF